MGDGTDYPQQTSTVNLIYNQQITNEIRIVCYNQTIYDDGRLEASEYVGLSLGIRQATAITNIYQGYNFAAIQIVDNDSMLVP